MKTLTALMGISIVGVAQAATVTPLQIPPALVGIGIPSRLACAPIGFRADDSVYGACHTVTSPPCSGRGCQPTTTTINYAVSWDVEGNATSSVACEQTVHHSPGADRVTYLNGHSATDCFNVMLNPIGTTVNINGLNYYYVSTSVDGAYELVDSAIVTF